MTNVNTTNSSNFPNMNAPEFVSITRNPIDLRIHTLLTEMGYNNTPDAFFIETSKLFNFYDSPVIDMENNVVTHAPDVLAAIANGVTSMIVYQVNMTSAQMRIFIALKHKYHSRNLIASFNTIKFYEEYLATNPEGIRLSASLEKDTTREKIAMLMQTSDSTIKRIKEVGENKFDQLGLIEQGHMSFKEAMGQIKSERMAASTAARNAAVEILPSLTSPEPTTEYYSEPAISVGIKNPTLTYPERYYEETEPANEISALELTPAQDDLYYEDGGNLVNDGSVKNEQTSNTPIIPEFLAGTFTVTGYGTLEISVTDNIPTVTVNGKTIANMSYTPVLNRESENGVAQSFILSQPGKNGFNIQLTIENFSQAA